MQVACRSRAARGPRRRDGSAARRRPQRARSPAQRWAFFDIWLVLLVLFLNVFFFSRQAKIRLLVCAQNWRFLEKYIHDHTCTFMYCGCLINAWLEVAPPRSVALLSMGGEPLLLPDWTLHDGKLFETYFKNIMCKISANILAGFIGSVKRWCSWYQ